MKQVIPKNVKVKVSSKQTTFNTLLIDGSNLLELSGSADKTLSSSGKPIGGIFQFLLQMKIMLKKYDFKYVYVFWDDINAGVERVKLLKEYKENRGKFFYNSNESSYMNEVNKKINDMMLYFMNKNKKTPEKLAELEEKKKIFFWQRDILIDCLDELFIRQYMSEGVEADDLIGFYVNNKKINERIVIFSNDKDLTQLIADDVIIYRQSTKDFITTKNHKDIIGYPHQNVLLLKMLVGDKSDNIKGIKGLGEKTVLDKIEGFKDKAMSLEEVISLAKTINEERVKKKQKPLQWANNIVNRVTEGSQGIRIFEINKKIIDLKNPLLTSEAVQGMSELMYNKLDEEDRSFTNLYKIIQDNDIDMLKEENKFSTFFYEFSEYIYREKNN